ISQPRASELMWEHWNPRCNPPWGEDEHDHLEQKIRNAYRYNTSPPGNLTPEYRTAKAKLLFEPQDTGPKDSDEKTVGRFRFVSRAGMEHIEPPEWIIKDLLPDESYAILFGPWGSFKTFVALDMALSIACGFPVDSTWEVVQPGPVLFALSEGRSSITKRVTGWESLHFAGAMVSDFVLVDPVPTTTVSEEALDAFVGEALRRHPNGYKAVFIDTLGRAMEGADENSQRDASAMTTLAHRLRHDLGGSVLALHHTGHQDDRRPRGSSVIGADADTMVRVARRGKDRLVRLHMTKQKDAPEWDKPRLVRLHDVRTSLGASTLVAGPPTEEDLKEKTREQEAAVMEVLDREVKAILAAVTAAYVDRPGARIDDADGVRVDLAEGWVHVRASNTEDIMRITAEAPPGGAAEAMAREARMIVDGILGESGE
ncbi:hypothetical protein LCGC14_2016450, partial [marine sediment metagenome]